MKKNLPFMTGAAFFWVTDRIWQWSVSRLLLISVAGILMGSMLAQYASLNDWLYSASAILMPVVMVIFMMGLCKFNFMGRIENAQIYKWLIIKQ